MREQFIDKRFQKGSLEVIGWVDDIVTQYARQGYVLTLRQLYYRLVATGKISNEFREYKRVGRVVNDARLAGVLDWRAIEDRTRSLTRLPNWPSPIEILDAAHQSFKLDHWKNQPWRLEVWVEKDALIQVVGRACDRYDVPYFSSRGYTSQSAMYNAYRRVKENDQRDQRTLIIHLADHDPSGIDMTRDAKDRYTRFGAFCKVHRLALNMEQVQLYNPPPNFAKEKDSRLPEYRAQFGMDSWELDALEPKVIDDLVAAKIEEYRDLDLFDEVMEKEESMLEFLQDVKDGATSTYGGNDD